MIFTIHNTIQIALYYWIESSTPFSNLPIELQLIWLTWFSYRICWEIVVVTVTFGCAVALETNILKLPNAIPPVQNNGGWPQSAIGKNLLKEGFEKLSISL